MSSAAPSPPPHRCETAVPPPVEAQARAIARAICADYGLNPQEYERHGGEHPIIRVIVRHVAPALAKLSGEAGDQVVFRQQESVKRMLADVSKNNLLSLIGDLQRTVQNYGARIAELEAAIRVAMSAFQQIDHQATDTLTKLDLQEGRT